MIDILDKTLCSGCHGCASICPKKCITMKTDEEGFWYPSVDTETCIHCNLCENVCPILNKKEKVNEDTIAYACNNANKTIVKKSSSAGIFTELAQYVLSQSGVVVGAAFTEDFSVEHTFVTTIEDLEKLRGSKYLQSKMNDIFTMTKKYLDEGKLVYFSGTPCQIDGLKMFLRKEYSNLICQDIICHGVCSPKAFKAYLDDKNKIFNEKPVGVFFREKMLGWKNFCVRIDYPSRSYILNHRDDTYMQAFLKHLIIRPSCFVCHSKGIARHSDITLADFWGIHKVLPELEDKDGTSLVVIHSEKGQKLWEAIATNITHQQVDIQEAAKYNKSIVVSIKPHEKRDEFMRLLDTHSFDALTRKYIKKKRFVTVKRIFRKIVRKLKRR